MNAAGIGVKAPGKRKRETVRRYAGLAVLLVVALIVIGVKTIPGSDPATPPAVGTCAGSDITVDGIVGGKLAFMQDPDVVSILKNRYCLTATFRRVGSIDQVPRCVPPLDYCWPSGQTAGQLIQQKLGSTVVKSEIIFNSPIVMYTWAPIADALIAQGIVVKTGDTYFLTDFPKLAQMIGNNVPWSQIGLPQLYGPMIMFSSDPVQSNTGNSFAGYLANMLNGGQVVDDTSVNAVLPQVKAFFDKMGNLQSTTTDIFERIFTLGIGACPIVVAYESNLIEYAIANTSAAQQQYVRDNVRTLYPKPTVWSSQPMIALTDGGERLIAALRDPEIQRLGWEHHGFRPGVPGVPIDPNAAGLAGVPASIDSVIQLPNPAVMQLIIDAQGPAPSPTPTAFRREESYA